MPKKTNCTVRGKKMYRLRAPIGQDQNGKYLYKSFYGEGKTEAEAARDKYIDAHKRGPNPNSGDSFGSVAKYYTYNVFVNEDLAPGTIELYERQYRKKVSKCIILINKPCNEIVSNDIQDFLNNLADGKLNGSDIDVSQTAVKDTEKYLNHLFKYLDKEGYCRNVMPSITIPKIFTDDEEDEDEIKEISVFSQDDIDKIINTESEYHFLWLLALSTGLRLGELLALKIGDLTGSDLRVNKQVNCRYKIVSDEKREYEKVIKKPKSRRSIRTVPVPENVVQEYAAYKKLRMEEMLRTGDRSDLLFATGSGNLIDKSNIRHAWKSHLQKAGVEYKKIHTCRSTYCTLLCQRGVLLETASKIMGHSSIKVTAEYYRFVSGSEMGTAAEKINDLFVPKPFGDHLATDIKTGTK